MEIEQEMSKRRAAEQFEKQQLRIKQNYEKEKYA